MNNNKKLEDASKRPMNRNTMDDDVIIEGTASNSPATSAMSNPGTPRPDLDMHGNHGTPPPPMANRPPQMPPLSQHPQTKYTQLLAVIEDMVSGFPGVTRKGDNPEFYLGDLPNPGIGIASNLGME